MVRARARRGASAALARGDFYASTGALQTEVTITAAGVSVTAANPAARLRAIGRGGRVIAEGVGHIRAVGPRVRVEATDSAGRRAWTQPS